MGLRWGGGTAERKIGFSAGDSEIAEYTENGEAGGPAGRRNRVEDELELSKDMVARWLMLVKNNLLVIRMNVAGLTQWGSSWLRERVCGRGGIRKNCGNLWKSQKLHVQNQDLGTRHPDRKVRECDLGAPLKY